MPDLFINSPARIKKGIAIKGKTSIPVNILCAITIKGMFFIYNIEKLAIPKLKAIGIPIAKHIKNIIIPVNINSLLDISLIFLYKFIVLSKITL